MVTHLNNIRLCKKADTFLTSEEIAEGAGKRLRPIIITFLTTCAGLFPTAYGIAGPNPFITPLVMVMFWGSCSARARVSKSGHFMPLISEMPFCPERAAYTSPGWRFADPGLIYIALSGQNLIEITL